MNEILIIFLGVTARQAEWWRTYDMLDAGYEHDLLVAYINRDIIPEVKNKYGKVIYESKIVNGSDIPKRAFGAYRYFFDKYKDQYKYFGFVSDDVLIRSANWLKRCIEPLKKYPGLGWVSTQIYSEAASGCFPDHLRAPIWFAKSDALREVNWAFEDDHDGELKIADQFLEKGFFGIQVGMKFDIAYDSLENGGYGEGDGIISCFEQKFFPEKHLRDPFSEEEVNLFEQETWTSIMNNKIKSYYAISPHRHIKRKNFISELGGVNGLIYQPSLKIAKSNVEVFELPQYNIAVIKDFFNVKYDKKVSFVEKLRDYSKLNK